MKAHVLLLCVSLFAISACATTGAQPRSTTSAAKKDADIPAAVPALATTSIAELERLKDQGDVSAMVELGSRYGTGKGVKVDYDKAVALFRVAADKNDPMAQYLLGVAYFSGAGAPKDEAIAVMWFERSAAQNLVTADYSLGMMIAYGRGGIPATWAGAVPILWKAAVQGDTRAAYALGLAYNEGNDVDRNVKAAAYWFRRANSYAYNAPALVELAKLIQHGEVEWQPGDPPKDDPNPGAKPGS
jgi:TPR repeat protein